MRVMVKITDLPSFDMASSLRTEEDITNYLHIVQNEENVTENEWNHALEVAAQARKLLDEKKEA